MKENDKRMNIPCHLIVRKYSTSHIISVANDWDKNHVKCPAFDCRSSTHIVSKKKYKPSKAQYLSPYRIRSSESMYILATYYDHQLQFATLIDVL